MHDTLHARALAAQPGGRREAVQRHCSDAATQGFDSVTESITDARRHLARAVVVCSAERVALIKKKVRIGDVEDCDQNYPLRRERLACLQIDHRMRWLVIGAIAFEKPEPKLTEPDAPTTGVAVPRPYRR